MFAELPVPAEPDVLWSAGQKTGPGLQGPGHGQTSALCGLPSVQHDQPNLLHHSQGSTRKICVQVNC